MITVSRKSSSTPVIMSYADASSAYRQMEVFSASPGQLVVMVYDYLLVQLKRADIALETRDIELRAVALSRANAAITELVSGLDLERGGPLSKQLSSLYSFFLGELIDIGRYSDRQRLARISVQVGELRTAFAAISSRPAASAA
ncbi:MAG: fliS [Gemmatimonadetes bacterium]|nr:fliS [Gemmatimonadota bacterium]